MVDHKLKGRNVRGSIGGAEKRGLKYFCDFIEAISGSLARWQEAGCRVRRPDAHVNNVGPAMETGQDRTSSAPSKELS